VARRSRGPHSPPDEPVRRRRSTIEHLEGQARSPCGVDRLCSLGSRGTAPRSISTRPGNLWICRTKHVLPFGALGHGAEKLPETLAIQPTRRGLKSLSLQQNRPDRRKCWSKRLDLLRNDTHFWVADPISALIGDRRSVLPRSAYLPDPKGRADTQARRSRSSHSHHPTSRKDACRKPQILAQVLSPAPFPVSTCLRVKPKPDRASRAVCVAAPPSGAA